MLINVRGTSGSGKSTVVRQLMAQCGRKPIYDMFGLRYPEAYKLMQPVYVIGPYTKRPNLCGGCDRILPFALVPQLIQKYAQRGDVIFEGLLISTCYGVIGQLTETHKSAVMFLDTPLEACIARVEARRRAAGNFRPLNPKLLIEKYDTIARLKDKFGARAMSVSDRDAVATIMQLLSTNGDINGHF